MEADSIGSKYDRIPHLSVSSVLHICVSSDLKPSEKGEKLPGGGDVHCVRGESKEGK